MFKIRSSFVKIPKNRQFEFTPRYYDAEKEEMEQRRKEIERNNDSSPEAVLRKEDLRKKFRDARKETLAMHNGNKLKYRLRMLLIIGILSYICYYLIA